MRNSKVNRNRNFIQKINSVRRAVMIMQIGGNDLCSRSIGLVNWSNGLSLCKNNLSSLRMLRYASCSFGANRDLLKHRLMRFAVIVDRMLTNMLEVQDNVVFWRYFRIMQSPLDILDKDRVNLSSFGTKNFYRRDKIGNSTC